MKAFEFWGWRDKDLEAIRDRAAQCGLQVATFGMDTGGAMVDATKKESFLDGLKASIGAARKLGVKTLLCTVGQELPNVDRAVQHQAIVDKLTTVHTRPMFDAVLAKELERAGRVGQSVSLILFDVDHLSTINQGHGYGVGDRILERLGILIRQYFRQHDWVARHSEDSIAVLLSGTDAAHASELAERVRHTVEERLEFVDHRTDRPVRVTISAAVVNLEVAVGDVIDPERLLADAEAAVERAKQDGRNRVVRVDGYSGKQQPDRAQS